MLSEVPERNDLQKKNDDEIFLKRLQLGNTERPFNTVEMNIFRNELY